ncbi:MORN repeat-containing protein [Massilia suwonensis]|uniref:MORN repeat-containing protein n=1 Tax=Massilia suwonensis TaxID=648895 RepID=A0ABW0MI53_9BURK
MHTSAFLFALGMAFGCSSALAQGVGAAAGEVTLKLPGGGTYIGTVTNGVPDGKGYFKDADGMQYEGEVHMGQRTGVAEALYPNGNRYKGEWKDGKPDGNGTMTYMLGGSYEGRWKQGVRDGRGIMTFAGSGRRAEVGFMEGERVDIKSSVPEPEPPKERYALRDANAKIGSHFSHKISTSAIPLNVGWEQLTPAQQRIVRDDFPALDEADEPPYPVKGPQTFFARLAELGGKYQLHEDLRVYVLIGADGKVVSVTSIGIEDPEARRLAGVLAGLVKYKPARCGGQPCQMIFPFNVRLSVTY